jgi:peroxiredoxin
LRYFIRVPGGDLARARPLQPVHFPTEHAMSIQIGDRIPEVALKLIRNGMETLDTHTLFEGKKVLLFAVPGAFTPTCSEHHLPGYVEHHSGFINRGIRIYCTSVNDAFVMQAWGKSQNAPEDLLMLSDGNADLAKALGLELDASGYGMGLRSKRYALYAEDGVVKKLWVEAPGEFKVSAAEYVLGNLT